jgi:hypothetical protein
MAMSWIEQKVMDIVDPKIFTLTKEEQLLLRVWYFGIYCTAVTFLICCVSRTVVKYGYKLKKTYCRKCRIQANKDEMPEIYDRSQ